MRVRVCHRCGTVMKKSFVKGSRSAQNAVAVQIAEMRQRRVILAFLIGIIS